MDPPGLRPIKVLELAKKWRPLVPEEFCDDFCPLPTEGIEEFVRRERDRDRENESECVGGVSNEETDVPTEDHNQTSANESELTGDAHAVEPSRETTTQRHRGPNKCRICKQIGHNARTCPQAA